MDEEENEWGEWPCAPCAGEASLKEEIPSDEKVREAKEGLLATLREFKDDDDGEV